MLAEADACAASVNTPLLRAHTTMVAVAVTLIPLSPPRWAYVDRVLHSCRRTSVPSGWRAKNLNSCGATPPDAVAENTTVTEGGCGLAGCVTSVTLLTGAMLVGGAGDGAGAGAGVGADGG
jgi:hypothetical protein